jgi:phage terminase Nu1 subunit (DNA packaging protein)
LREKFFQEIRSFVKKKAAKKKAPKKAPRKTPSLTIQALADAFGVSTRTIDKYVKRGCPRDSVESAKKWRDENIRATAQDVAPDEIQIELKRAELADKTESARSRQIKNDMLEGLLIRKEDVERDLAVGLSRLTNRLKSLGLRCANLCPAELKAPIKEAVEGTVELALRELCEDLRR